MMKYILVISLFLSSLIGFSQSLDTVVIDDEIYTIVEQMPQFPQSARGMNRKKVSASSIHLNHF